MESRNQFNLSFKFSVVIILLIVQWNPINAEEMIENKTVQSLRTPCNTPIKSHYSTGVNANWQTELSKEHNMYNPVAELRTHDYSKEISQWMFPATPTPCQSCQFCQPPPALPAPIPTPHIKSMPCPRSYMFSCQPRLTLAPCRKSY